MLISRYSVLFSWFGGTLSVFLSWFCRFGGFFLVVPDILDYPPQKARRLSMTAQKVLKQYFGYDEFRSGQEALITDIMAGRDVLGIMPTGAGKSICFQVPALMMDGVTLIVSPLISLMKDQVNALTQSGAAAAFINSSLTERQIDKALYNARNGAYKMIYAAPERLLTPGFVSFAESVRISMLTVDEAHCISQWGQDFRPSYVQIPEFISGLPRRPVVSAFTATATPKVREDIVKMLRLDNPRIQITGFDRPNLRFDILRPRDKYTALTAFLSDKRNRSGIVYCGTRKTVEEVCGQMRADGYSVSRYHAGLSDQERHDNQDDFLYDRVQIMAATTAFGMGIDKSNVSFVVHYNMPKDIESYYQEAGRAGRDGSAADCVLLYSGKDVRIHEWMIDNDRETQYQDRETEEALKERNRRRLREMTFYSTTTDCLRAFILKYFGESPPNFCGNCGNCNTHFESVDITEDARQILLSIACMNERYGMHTIIDVMSGKMSEKVERHGLNKMPMFGVNNREVRQLRDIVSFLVMHKYLVKTDGEYPVLKLGERADEVMRGRAAVTMKMPKGRPAKEDRGGHRDYKDCNSADTGKPQPVRPVDKRLFEALRKLRTEIANGQGVPAFVVFADSTLIDMCIKIPKTREEFLNVSGVGEVKLEKFGGQFLNAIAGFLQNDGITDETVSHPPEKFDASEIEITEEPATVSVIADRINCALIKTGRKKISGLRINNWLTAQGYLSSITVEGGKTSKVPTQKGTDTGIITEDRVIRGEEVVLNLYKKTAQEMIVQNALAIAAFGKQGN
jgi:ATP-dependent DNA helicase RecQ